MQPQACLQQLQAVNKRIKEGATSKRNEWLALWQVAYVATALPKSGECNWNWRITWRMSAALVQIPLCGFIVSYKRASALPHRHMRPGAPAVRCAVGEKVILPAHAHAQPVGSLTCLDAFIDSPALRRTFTPHFPWHLPIKCFPCSSQCPSE